MQLGISTYTFPWAFGIGDFKPSEPFTAEDLLAFAAQREIRVVQFGDNYPLHQLSEAELMTIKGMADDRGIQLEVGTRRLTFSNISHYIYIAKLFHSPFLRIIIDDADYHPGESEVIEVIKKVVPQLQSSTIRLAIGNHDRFPAKTLKQIIQHTDPEWIGICLDTANSLGAGEGIHEVIDHLAPYTLNLHVKDFTINRVPYKMGFTVSGCAAGKGMLDVPKLIEEVKKYGRCNTVTLEIWSDPEPSIEATVQKEREWVAKSIDYLKTILS